MSLAHRFALLIFSMLYRLQNTLLFDYDVNATSKLRRHSIVLFQHRFYDAFALQ
jgi:hypothetical protein